MGLQWLWQIDIPLSDKLTLGCSQQGQQLQMSLILTSQMCPQGPTPVTICMHTHILADEGCNSHLL